MTAQPVHVPADATRCRKCTVFMPVPGIVTVSKRDSTLCTDCEELENRRLTMARVSSDQVNRTRVQTWAQWRREGKSYDEITALDTLEPSYPTIKKYLEMYGFDGEGQPLNGNGANGQHPEPAIPIPKGWGKVEPTLDPRVQRGEEYRALLRVVVSSAKMTWQRIEAPTPYRARRLSTLVREQRPDIERRVREVDKVPYFYFRLKKDGA